MEAELKALREEIAKLRDDLSMMRLSGLQGVNHYHYYGQGPYQNPYYQPQRLPYANPYYQGPQCLLNYSSNQGLAYTQGNS